MAGTVRRQVDRSARNSKRGAGEDYVAQELRLAVSLRFVSSVQVPVLVPHRRCCRGGNFGLGYGARQPPPLVVSRVSFGIGPACLVEGSVAGVGRRGLIASKAYAGPDLARPW